MTSSRHCRLWHWKHNSDGYGVLRYSGKQFLAHRMMWQAFNGPIPRGYLVLHKCDTPACFNLNHLFLGTYSDNNRDRAKKNRSALGERSGRCKLTDTEVGEIRELYDSTDLTQAELGIQYGVSNHQISMLVRNLSRKGVTNG